jgi:hypothetical protein
MNAKNANNGKSVTVKIICVHLRSFADKPLFNRHGAA